MPFAHTGPLLVAPVDDKFAKYRKMKDAKLPDGAIRQKMTVDGFSNTDIEDFLSGKTTTAVSKPATEPNTLLVGYNLLLYWSKSKNK